ncbi:MAG: thioredoxin [Thermodesulfobacteriota bacterium]
MDSTKSVNYDTDNFEKDVLERSYSMPVLVDFWAEWCGPCRVLGPVLEKLAEESNGSWALVKLNTDKHPELSARYGIRSIPNVKLFVDGKVVDGFIGALPENMVRGWLIKALPSKFYNQIKNAERLLDDGRIVEAQKILEEVVGAEENNDLAITLLARTYVFADPNKALEIIDRIGPTSEYSDIAEAVKTFGEMFLYLEDSTPLKDGAARERYLSAIKSLRSQNFGEALESFIEVIRKDRYYDNDGSRRACVAIFRFLGEDHEVTKEYRQVFATVLYA